MSRRPVQVVNTEASCKLVSHNFEYCPLCCTIKSAYSRPVPADMCGVQLQKLLERSARCRALQRSIHGPVAELYLRQNTSTNVQQAVEERGPPEPSALTFGSVCVLKRVPGRRARADVSVPAIAETGSSYSRLVIGRFKPTLC